MKKYEGLFILNTAGKEEGIKELIDKVEAEIKAAGGQIETTQKMDKKSFARVANRRHTSGFYLNVIFSAPPGVLAALRHKLALHTDVFRVLLTTATAAPAPAPLPAA